MVTTLQRKQAAMAKAKAAQLAIKNQPRRIMQPTAPIRPEEMYALKLVPSLFGVSRHTLVLAQRKGLVTHQLGNLKFVMGSDLINFIRSNSGANQDRQDIR